MSESRKHAPEVIVGWWDRFAHYGVMAALFLFFGGLLAWFGRAFVTGGVPERIMTSVVIPLLCFILFTVAGVFWGIIREGKRKGDPTP